MDFGRTLVAAGRCSTELGSGNTVGGVAAGHVLLVPLYSAARWWDNPREPFGFA